MPRIAQASPIRELMARLDEHVPYHPTDEQKLADFLEDLSCHGIIGEACARAGISRKKVWQARKDPGFNRLFEEAQALGLEAIEDEAVLRATKGSKEPVFWKGRRVATVRKKSDLLLMFILKAKRPDLYRDNYTPPEQEYVDDGSQSPAEAIAGRLARIAARKREE